jgi:hypothetical protein
VPEVYLEGDRRRKMADVDSSPPAAGRARHLHSTERLRSGALTQLAQRRPEGLPAPEHRLEQIA